MPADILAKAEQRTVAIEQRRCVQPAGPVEHRLRLAQCIRQRVNDCGVNQRRIQRQHLTALYVHRFDGRFAADAAARGCIKVALQAFEIYLDFGLNFYRY